MGEKWVLIDCGSNFDLLRRLRDDAPWWHHWNLPFSDLVRREGWAGRAEVGGWPGENVIELPSC